MPRRPKLGRVPTSHVQCRRAMGRRQRFNCRAGRPAPLAPGSGRRAPVRKAPSSEVHHESPRPPHPSLPRFFQAFLPVAAHARRPFGLAGLPGSGAAATPSLATPTASDLWRLQPLRPRASKYASTCRPRPLGFLALGPTASGRPLSPLRSKSGGISRPLQAAHFAVAVNLA